MPGFDTASMLEVPAKMVGERNISYTVKVGHRQKTGQQNLYLNYDHVGEYGFQPDVYIKIFHDSTRLVLRIDKDGQGRKLSAKGQSKANILTLCLPKGLKMDTGKKRFEILMNEILIYK